jgi:hypothetical protein
MGSELVTMCSDLEASSLATAATVEPPSRMTVWPSSIRPAVSRAMRLFSSLCARSPPQSRRRRLPGGALEQRLRRRAAAPSPPPACPRIAAHAGLGSVQLAAKRFQVEEVPGLEHLADSELPFSSFHRFSWPRSCELPTGLRSDAPFTAGSHSLRADRAHHRIGDRFHQRVHLHLRWGLPVSAVAWSSE